MTGRRYATVLVPAVVFVLLFAVLPVVLLFATALGEAGGLAGIAAILNDPLNRAAVNNSLVQGALSAALAVALGYPAGVFFGRFRFPGRATVRSFLLVPFLLPSLVVVLGVLDLFGPSGILSSTLPGVAFFGAGLPAIVAANLVFNVPVVVLFTATGAESASVELEETVATLGGSPGRAYRDVWARPTWVGAAVGGLLTFLFSALSFAPPLLLCGSRCYTVEARIWSLDQILLEPTAAGVLALAMVLLFLVPTVVYLLLLGRLRALPGRRAMARPFSLRDPVAIALAAETAVVLLGVLTVLAAVLYRTVAPVGGGPAGAAWSALFSSSTTARVGVSVYGMVANTLLFATAATVVAILFGIVLGYAVVGRPSRSRALGVLLFLPLLISPVVLAFALASFWRPLLGGATNVWILVIVSQAVLALPFALQSIEIPLSGLTPRAREAAQSLGAAPWNAFLDADLPRVRAGLATAGLFAFALGLGEFTATNFLVTAQFTTLPVALYRLADLRSFAVADAAAGLLLLLSLAVFAVLTVGGRRVEL
ncbi:MAG: ABC transporter permease subunit [Thermoplasmata archaeon]|jgi:thiamine transport system permease protein